uniref:Tetraspanin-5 n=1 Tax=Oncorhynchus kisutch TaxID=8019 RepID=A0A8C7MIA8_ONCKI
MMSGKYFKAHEVSCCIKYFIFGFNIIFWLLGVAFLGIGLWAWSEKFSVFLGIIFFLELTAGVLAFVFKDWIKDQLNFFINNNIRAYRDDIDLQNLIDFTQEYWECCGAFGADDWNLNIYFNCTDSNPSREKCGVPFSCCTKDPAEDVINTQCGYDIRAKADSEQMTFIYIKGCVPQFEKWLQDNLTVVAGIFIGIALLQVGNTCLIHKPQIHRSMNPSFTCVCFQCIFGFKAKAWDLRSCSIVISILDILHIDIAHCICITYNCLMSLAQLFVFTIIQNIRDGNQSKSCVMEHLTYSDHFQ